jgi:hypothetical protein
MEVTGRRGRRRKQLLYDFKEKRTYWIWKEEELDRTVCRTRFGTGCGPVVRQTADWLTEWRKKRTNERTNVRFSFHRNSAPCLAATLNTHGQLCSCREARAVQQLETQQWDSNVPFSATVATLTPGHLYRWLKRSCYQFVPWSAGSIVDRSTSVFTVVCCGFFSYLKMNTGITPKSGHYPLWPGRRRQIVWVTDNVV